jgi:hypothetical protein
MAKPTVKPRWASTVTADPTRYVDPPSGKKDIGWDVGERPPAQYENWLRGTTGQWIDWLDTFESTPHTWTATQTFTPSTAVPGIVLGYNSATDTADETPSLAFQAGTKTQSVVDRLGAPSQRWLRREYMWWGAPLLLTTGAADTDVLVTGETRLWQRHSGVGPVVGSPNDFQVRVRLPEAGVAPYSFNSYRYLQQRSVFESIVDQYHVLYGDSLLVLGATFRVLVMEFTAIVVPSAADSLTAIGLMARGSDLLTGSDGRNLTTASYAFSLATANTYGNKWQVFKRNAGVTTIVDTGVSSDTYRRVRIEMVKDSSLGGPRTNVFIDGSNVYTSSTGLLTDTYLAFGSTQVPLAVGSIASMSLSPVRITALYDAI